MTATATAPPETAAPEPRADSQAALVLQEQPMIPVSRLKPDPDNPREDLDLNREFLASLSHNGVEVPLLIRSDPEEPGMCVVIEGHRRYFGALKVGLDEVPYKLVASRDEAARFLAMYLSNADKQRRNHSAWEQTRALFMAHQAGASKAQIRKTLGLKADQVRQAVKAGRLTQEQVTSAHELSYEWTIEEYGLLGEFSDDPKALERLKRTKSWNGSLQHTAEVIRRERAEAAEHKRIVERLTAEGMQVAEDLPDGGLPVDRLRTSDQPDGEDMTSESHAICPGHGMHFPGSLTEPVPYCSDPLRYGHGFRQASVAKRLRLRRRALEAGAEVLRQHPGESYELSTLEHDGQKLTAEEHLRCPGAQVYIPSYTLGGVRHYCSDPFRYGHTIQATAALSRSDQPSAPSRTLVVQGNREWLAAAEVRRDFLEQVGRRKSLPKGGGAFLGRALLERPAPIRDALGSHNSENLFGRFTGKTFQQAADEAAKATAGRLQVLLLAQVLAAYERQISGDGDRRNTWRTDRSNYLCSRDEAGVYLKFLIGIGYQPAPIEKAVATGVPYTGADPDQQNVEAAEEQAEPVTDPADEQAGDVRTAQELTEAA